MATNALTLLDSLSNYETAGSSATLRPAAQQTQQPQQKVYAGPVPSGYDEAKFRQTGQLVKLPEQKSPPPSGSSNGGAITEEEALKRGWDINNLPSGYSRFVDTYAEEARKRAEDLARQQEETARRNAEAEYNDTMNLLRTQKGEVGTVAGQQRTRAQEAGNLAKTDLAANKDTEIKKIEKERTGFQEQERESEETLGRNFIDLTRRIQASLRAGGIADSGYAQAQEGKATLDFNKGLRELKSKALGAYQDFSDAVIETNNFYERQGAKLAFELKNQIEDVDTWERQKIQEIQGQENKALSSKLAEIRNATLQAQQIKANIEQDIANKKYALDSWVFQFTTQAKAAVATAAQGKTSDAAKKINSYIEDVSNIKNVLDKYGGYIVKNQDGTFAVHGSVPGVSSTGDYTGTFSDVEIPVSQQWVTNYNAGLKSQPISSQYTNTPTYVDQLLEGSGNVNGSTQGSKNYFSNLLDAIRGR